MLLQAKAQLLNFQTAQEPNVTPSTTAARILNWQPPRHNFIKANCDVGLNSLSQTTGLVGIVRDEYGKVLASFCFKINGLHKPIIAKALDLKRIMLTCVELGLPPHIHFEWTVNQ